MAGFPPARLVAALSDQVIANDLPALPAARRADVVAFAGRRIAGLPSPMKLGVGLVAVVLGALGRVVGPARLIRTLSDHPVPGLGDFVRLVRSLGYAYVWETWPATGPDGADLG